MIWTSILVMVTNLIQPSGSLIQKQADTTETVRFHNALSQCFSLQDHSLLKIKNTTLLSLNYTTKQSIAHCGCKSALAQYRANQPHQELASGLIDFRGKNKLTLTLSNTPNLLSQKAITVSFACAQPN